MVNYILNTVRLGLTVHIGVFLLFNLGLSRKYWYSDKNCGVTMSSKIFVGINSNFARSGCYIQGIGGVIIGNYVEFARNVGVVSANHDLYCQERHNEATVIIGNYCWLGFGCIVLPGVILGTRTIVAAGAVVTKSFPDGYCVIGGNPAKIIKHIDKDRFVPWHYQEEFYGFIPKSQFEKVKHKYMKSEIIEEFEKWILNNN